MKIGTCADTAAGQILKEAGFDFIEMSVGGALKPDKPRAEFEVELKKIRNCPLPCLAVNCLIPGSMKITGPDVNIQALGTYVKTVCERAREAGIPKIVFGSGGARRCPDGFDMKKAYGQLVEFGRILGDEAGKNNVTIAVEPLNSRECNMLNSVSRTGEYVRKVDLPAFKLHADSYHWALENEDEKDFSSVGSLIRHAHIATYKERCAPGQEDCDFTSFAKLIRKCGYDDTIAIEGKWPAYEGIPLSDPRIAANSSHLRKAVEIIRGYF